MAVASMLLLLLILIFSSRLLLLLLLLHHRSSLTHCITIVGVATNRLLLVLVGLL